MSRAAFIFPGQGSQVPGMGRGLAASCPEAREVFERADAALGIYLSKLCFEGTEEELARTEITQPAVLTVSLAALRVLEARGLRPQVTAGHSLGEWTAHVAAGTLRFEDAVVAVRLRGRFMQEAVPLGEGAMAAILGLEAPKVESICREAARDEVVSPANYNAPRQVVIAGRVTAVERAVALALSVGARRAVTLPVTAPFHCALMEPAARRLEPVLRRLTFHDPAVPVYTNVDARAVRDTEASREALLRQVASPVRWQDEVGAMLADGVDTFVEVGPGRVLSGLVRMISKSARVIAVSDPGGVDAAVEELGVTA